MYRNRKQQKFQTKSVACLPQSFYDSSFVLRVAALSESARIGPVSCEQRIVLLLHCVI